MTEANNTQSAQTIEEKKVSDVKNVKDEKNNVERVYVVNLRREWLKAPKWKRAKKAVVALRDFVKRHLKVKIVKISPNVNQVIWNHGAKNPPGKIKIRAVKKEDIAEVYLAK